MQDRGFQLALDPVKVKFKPTAKDMQRRALIKTSRAASESALLQLSDAACCLQDGGFQLALDPVKVQFKLTAKDMQVAEESGTDLAQAMLKAVPE